MKQTDSYSVYKKEIVPILQKEFGAKNRMAVPGLVKIVVNCGMGEAVQDKKTIDTMKKQIAVITGQNAVITHAKKAISSFKLRQGDPIGLKVTLCGKRMYDFLTRFVCIALPRVRDFRGAPNTGFDGNGNYTIGVSEQTIFPELDYALVDKIRGFEITCVTSTRSDEQSRRLLELLGMPFEKQMKKEKV